MAIIMWSNNINLKAEAEAEIDTFVKERDKMLLACDVDLMVAFLAKHNPQFPIPSSRDVTEIALHRARTAARSLPLEARLLSKKWLSERDLYSLDDGELSEPQK
jgi:hypothetical protein